jgi:multidrug resistance efflux pump
MSKDKKWYMSRGIKIVATLLIALIVFILVKSGGNREKLETIKLEKGNVTSEIKVTGSIKPISTFNLAFEKSGRVAKKYKMVGDKVYKGEIVLALDTHGDEARLDDARARLESEEARLLEIKKGTRTEEIAVKEAEYNKVEQDLKNYYEDITKYISEAYNKADDAINRQLDDLFINDKSSNPEITFPVGDPQNKNIAKEERIKANYLLNQIKTINETLLFSNNVPLETKKTLLENTLSQIIAIQGILIKMSMILDDAVGPSSSVISSYKGYVDIARTNINNVAKSLSNLNQNLNSQAAYLEKIKRELILMKSGPTPEKLSQLENAVEIARAGLKIAEDNYKKNFIYSPTDGTVKEINTEIGEIVQAGQNVISIINDKKFEIESYITENDISKVSVGNSAIVILDAYGENFAFDAVISKIDPAEKVIDGVTSYRTLLEFTNEKENSNQIRPGLTANVLIITSKKEDVWKLPKSAIQKKDSKDYVFIKTSERGTRKSQSNIIPVEVKTGIYGTDGTVEIQNAEEIKNQFGDLEKLEIVLNPHKPK